MKYRFIDDLTSDVLFEAYGKDLEELFENSAEALFSVICKIEEIEAKEKIEFEFSGENEEEALYNFLSNLLAESEIAGLFLSKFEVKIGEENGNYSGKAIAYGEPITPEKGNTVVKAITYYKFKVRKNKIYKATVSCDI